MTTLSELSREMAEEYRSLTGRQITAEEYLAFRKQALKESDRGYGISEQNRPLNQSKPLPRTTADRESQVYKTAAAPAQIPIKPVTGSETQAPSKESDRKTDEDDPFFALCNKID